MATNRASVRLISACPHLRCIRRPPTIIEAGNKPDWSVVKAAKKARQLEKMAEMAKKEIEDKERDRQRIETSAKADATRVPARQPDEKIKTERDEQQWADSTYNPEEGGWWRTKIPKPAQSEWLIDVYRMFDDDSATSSFGGRLGLYNDVEDLNGASVIWMFLFFSKLCVRTETVPPNWDWDEHLLTASRLLPYALDKKGAKEKYGGESIFSPAYGKPSLRGTAGYIYGYIAISYENDSPRCKDLMKEFIANTINYEQVEMRDFCVQMQPSFFDDVGGQSIWLDLEKKLDLSLSDLIAKGAHADHGDSMWGGGKGRAML